MRLQKNIVFGVCVLLLAGLYGCQSKGKHSPQSSKPAVSGAKPTYKQSAHDGAPWWDKDVSGIPDAVPTPHYGPYKAAPYTVLGKKYYPMQDASRYREVGTASWYGTKFHGLDTANGEKYDLYGMTAAHKTLPLPSYVKVTNLDSGQSITVRVNDRGPFYSDRIIDLSFAAAKKLGFAERGVARVHVEGIDPVQWLAQRGQSVPSGSSVNAGQQVTEVERYSPPAQQHAGALTPSELSGQDASTAGLYLQVGAFANPDAAQLLRDKLATIADAPVFVSPVISKQQVLHRVRLGPVSNHYHAEQLQQQVRVANLGSPTLISVD